MDHRLLALRTNALDLRWSLQRQQECVNRIFYNISDGETKCTVNQPYNAVSGLSLYLFTFNHSLHLVFQSLLCIVHPIATQLCIAMHFGWSNTYKIGCIEATGGAYHCFDRSNEICCVRRLQGSACTTIQRRFTFTKAKSKLNLIDLSFGKTRTKTKTNKSLMVSDAQLAQVGPGDQSWSLCLRMQDYKSPCPAATIFDTLANRQTRRNTPNAHRFTLQIAQRSTCIISFFDWALSGWAKKIILY